MGGVWEGVAAPGPRALWEAHSTGRHLRVLPKRLRATGRGLGSFPKGGSVPKTQSCTSSGCRSWGYGQGGILRARTSGTLAGRFSRHRNEGKEREAEGG